MRIVDAQRPFYVQGSGDVGKQAVSGVALSLGGVPKVVGDEEHAFCGGRGQGIPGCGDTSSAAPGSGCRLLLSEGLQDGFTSRGVTIVNRSPARRMTVFALL